jgi:hypothetical protein
VNVVDRVHHGSRVRINTPPQSVGYIALRLLGCAVGAQPKTYPGTTSGVPGPFGQSIAHMTQEKIRVPSWLGGGPVIWHNGRYMDVLAAEAEIQKLRSNGDHVGAAEIELSIETIAQRAYPSY